jgi:hypothetical protein
MKDTVEVTFSDVVFLCFKTDISWSLLEGTQAFSNSFLIPKRLTENPTDIVDKIRAKAVAQKFHTLKIAYPGREPIVFEKLYFLGFQPGNDIYYERFSLADVRWPWPRGHISRAYNVRASLGDKFVPDTPAATISVGTLQDVPILIQDEIGYTSISLFPPLKERDGKTELRPWSIRDILDDIFDAIDEEYGISVDYTDLKLPRELAVESVYLDEPFDSALGKILTEAPQIGLFPDFDGTIRFFDRSDGSENAIIDKLDSEFEGEGHIEFVDHSWICPKEIVVLFTPEIEVRFDFYHKTGGTQIVKSKEGRWLENVAPLPDRSLPITVNGKAIRGLNSQYYTFDELILAWGAILSAPLPGMPATLTNISHRSIKEYYVNGNMFSAWARWGFTDYSSDWVARVGVIETHYLKTFRMNKRWRDKGVAWKANRVSLINQATGEMAPSSVYADIGLWYTKRGRGAEAKGAGLAVVKNTEGFFNDKINLAKPNTFAQIFITDVDQGIIEVQYLPDPLGHFKPLPAKVKNAPTLDVGDKNRPRYIDEVSNGLAFSLEDEHELATVLTGTPAYTNSTGALYAVSVKPADVKAINPELAEKIKGAKGERLYIRVSPGLQTARVAWSDDNGIPEIIEAAFGVGNRPPNFDKLPVMNRKNMEKLAQVLATAMYTKFRDRFRGRRTGLLTKVVPRGSIAEVAYNVSAGTGRPSTTIAIGGEIVAPNYMNLLPKGIRAELLRQVKKY